MTSPYLQKPLRGQSEVVDAIKAITDASAREYQKRFALERLAKLRTDLLEEIDGADETRGRDTRISEMIRDVEYVQGQVEAIQ